MQIRVSSPCENIFAQNVVLTMIISTNQINSAKLTLLRDHGSLAETP